MQTIYKYPLGLGPGAWISMPSGATLLSVGAQGTDIFVWAQVDTMKPIEMRRFDVVGTGQPMPAGNLKFLGAVMLARGALVFHVFERQVGSRDQTEGPVHDVNPTFMTPYEPRKRP